MNGRRRHAYLSALGVDTWRLRASDAEALAVREEAAPSEWDRHSRTIAAPVAAPPPPASPTDAVAAAAPQSAPAAARIDVPADWSGLRAMVGACRRCKLCTARTQTVFGVGSETAPLMVIGEGPGADEDAQGEPFVGRAGKLLDEMLRSIGRSRRETREQGAVFIANVVKCRPPGNRDPEGDEVEACRPYLDRQIELVKPRLIVALGRIAAQRLLNSDAPLSKLRGPMYQYGPARTPLVITYHPAYLLRSPREKAKSWDDLKKIHRFLREPAAAEPAA